MSEISVVNYLGNQVLSLNIQSQDSGGIFSLDVSKLPNGLYFVKLTFEGGVMTSPMIISR